MNANTQENCSSKVRRSMESTIETLRLMLEPVESDVVIDFKNSIASLDESEVSFDPEDYNDNEDNSIQEESMDEIKSHYFDELREQQYYLFSEYGLSFDYVAPNTFEDQDQAYFRYLISWGGPSTEFRFYVSPDVSPDLSLYHCEYWYLDWFDGASAEVPNDFAQLLYEQFNETGTTQHLIDQEHE